MKRNKPSGGKYHPLTTSQREIWFDQLLHRMLHTDDSFYNIGGYVSIDGLVDAARIEQAVNLLVCKHDALRLVLVEERGEDGVPLQAIAEDMPVQMPLHDFSKEADPYGVAQEWMQGQLEVPFVLEGGRLFRFHLLKIDERIFYWVVHFHHLIADGWSIGLLCDSLGKIYSALEAGEAPNLLAPSYVEFIEQDRQYFNSAHFEKHRAYWQNKYREIPAPLFYPRYRQQYAEGIAPSRRETLRLPRELYERIEAISSANQSTPFHLILAATYAYFARAYQQEDLAIGLPILNRSNAMFKATAGSFVGVSAIRISLGTEFRFSELMREVGRILKQDYRYQRFPLSDLNRSLGLRRDSRAQVFDLSVAYASHDHDLRFGQFRAKANMSSSSGGQTPLTVHFRENPHDDEVLLYFVYNQGYFEESDINALGKRFVHFLEQVLIDVETPVRKISLVTPTEAKLFTQWNATRSDIPQEQCVQELFEAQVRLNPDATALLFEDEKFTYEELNTQANRLAHYLIKQGVGPEQFVGVLLPRSAVCDRLRTSLFQKLNTLMLGVHVDTWSQSEWTRKKIYVADL